MVLFKSGLDFVKFTAHSFGQRGALLKKHLGLIVNDQQDENHTIIKKVYLCDFHQVNNKHFTGLHLLLSWNPTFWGNDYIFHLKKLLLKFDEIYIPLVHHQDSQWQMINLEKNEVDAIAHQLESKKETHLYYKGPLTLHTFQVANISSEVHVSNHYRNFYYNCIPIELMSYLDQNPSVKWVQLSDFYLNEVSTSELACDLSFKSFLQETKFKRIFSNLWNDRKWVQLERELNSHYIQFKLFVESHLYSNTLESTNYLTRHLLTLTEMYFSQTIISKDNFQENIQLYTKTVEQAIVSHIYGLYLLPLCELMITNQTWHEEFIEQIDHQKWFLIQNYFQFSPLDLHESMEAIFEFKKLIFDYQFFMRKKGATKQSLIVEDLLTTYEKRYEEFTSHSSFKILLKFEQLLKHFSQIKLNELSFFLSFHRTFLGSSDNFISYIIQKNSNTLFYLSSWQNKVDDFCRLTKVDSDKNISKKKIA